MERRKGRSKGIKQEKEKGKAIEREAAGSETMQIDVKRVWEKEEEAWYGVREREQEK